MSNSGLPQCKDILYAFDVDGTLTPHPGAHPDSMWHRGELYLSGLSPEIIAQMRALFALLPAKFILISRNYEETIYYWLAQLDPSLPDRIDREHSSFRISGVAPTSKSKQEAFAHIKSTGRPIVYVDDDPRDIALAQRIIPDAVYIAHIETWLGDPHIFEAVITHLRTFCGEV
jgi:hypothetical protein